MTFLEAQQKVQYLTKLHSIEPAKVQLIKDAINIGYLETARSTPLPEFLSPAQVVPVTAGAITGETLGLPDDFLAAETILFKSGTSVWELAEENEPMIPPAPIYGKPRAYKIVSGALASPAKVYGIRPTPASGMLNTDTLVIDYYRIPTALVNDADLIIGNRISDEVVRRATNLVEIYQGKVDQAREFMAPLLSTMRQPQPQSA